MATQLSAIGRLGTGFNVDENGVVSVSGGGGGGITWNEVTGTTQLAAADNGYIANNESRVTITLPSTIAVGKIIEVAGSGAGGWKISQNAGQKIVFGSVETTEGTTGYMESNSRYESVKLICITSNAVFSVLRATGAPELI